MCAAGYKRSQVANRQLGDRGIRVPPRAFDAGKTSFASAPSWIQDGIPLVLMASVSNRGEMGEARDIEVAAKKAGIALLLVDSTD